MNINRLAVFSMGFVGGVALIAGCGGGSVAAAADSIWQLLGGNAYYSRGNVGVGTDDPRSLLHVSSDQDSSTEIRVTNNNDSPNSFSGIMVGTDTTGMSGAFRYYPESWESLNDDYDFLAGYAEVVSFSLTKGLIIRETSIGGEINFVVNGSNEAMTIQSNGSVGIGTSNPASRLAVSGLPMTTPDASGNAGIVCVTNDGNFWVDGDGVADCL